jgi:hypothetical protein
MSSTAIILKGSDMWYLKVLLFIVCFFGLSAQSSTIDYQKLFASVGYVGSITSLLYWMPFGVQNFVNSYQNMDQGLFARIILDTLHTMTLDEILGPKTEDQGKSCIPMFALNTLGSAGSAVVWFKAGKELYEKNILSKKGAFLVGSRIILDTIVCGVTMSQAMQ